MWNILLALFGLNTYQYKVTFSNKTKITVDAKDFNHVISICSGNIAYIEPLEDIRYTKGENGANMYLYEALAHIEVFGENEEQAKGNFNKHLTIDSVKITDIKKPLWVNKSHYKRN